jgi:hypothetical protein
MSNKKNEIDEMEEVFKNFLKVREKEINTIPNYLDIYQKKQALYHFNKRIITCNK